MDCISEDVVVLFQRDKTYRPFRLKKGRKLNFEKVSFYPDRALGCYYGSRFKVQNQQLVLVESNTDGAVINESASGLDNRKICDDGTSQELTEGDIKVMKGQGISGQGIVASMIEHSCSFRDKTKYSQEKYIKKKEKKYIPIFRIIKTTTKLLCDMYSIQSPSKTYHLRKDTVAQILTRSNVHAHSNMIVMETSQGFMVGAMLERMGGYGKLVQVFYGDYPVRTILDNFGHLSSSDKSVLMSYPLHRIGSLLTAQEARTVAAVSERLAGIKRPQGELAPLHQSERERNATTIVKSKRVELLGDGKEENDGTPPCKKKKTEDEGVSGENPLEGKKSAGSEKAELISEKESSMMLVKTEKEKSSELAGDKMKVEGIYSQLCLGEQEGVTEECTHESTEKTLEGNHRSGDSHEKAKKEEKRRRKEEAYKSSEDLLTQRKMDGLVVACRHHPEPIVMTLVNFVAPSRPIVIYCHLLEPLVQCYKSLKETDMVFNLQISETWMRHYQVLEERTHPEMNMGGQGGYLLTGTVVKKKKS